jgi:uncharacterized protein
VVAAGQRVGALHGPVDVIGDPGPVLRLGLEVQHLYVDGDTTIAELLSTSVTNEGAPFANRYCWVCRFDGDTIVEVRAYLDSLMVDYTILRNELAP